ncbi:MAG: YkgJ family cysteine cluster protein [Spongiibacteraceae bacterium]
MKACNSCGKCCIKYSDGDLSASLADIEGWELFNPEIHDYVRDGEIWFDPSSKQRLALCPWLRKEPNKNRYSCDIYLDRPEDCRHYPVTIEQMVGDECEMLEVQDLSKPKQAQQSLNQLMADSRPPFIV